MLLFSIFISFLAYAHGQQKSYDGWTLIKATPSQVAQVDFFTNLRQELSGFEFQVWQEGGLTRPFEVFLSPEAKDVFVAKLDELEIPYEVKSDNIQQAINSEKRPASTRALSASGVKNSAWFSTFLNLNQINSAIQDLAKQYPKLVTIESIGKTHLGKSIPLVKISSGGGAKPGVWIDGGFHAREWASPATVLYILNKLVTGYSTDAAIKNYIDKINFYIVPVVNQDGYEYTHTKDRMWRKNRRPGNGGCDGVDLNRNFDYGFGGAGTSSDKCEDIYRGQSAFSEPESQAVRDYILGHKDLKSYISIHAYSNMWFYPYGDKVNSYPADVKELAAVAQAGAKRLGALYGTKYQVGTAANLIYEAAGGSDDWAKGKAAIKYVYTLEVRPDGNAPGNGFILPAKDIVPVGEETYAGLTAVFDAVARG